MPDPLILPRLRAVTRPIDSTDELIDLTDPTDPLVWLRRGEGMVAAGPALLHIAVGEEGRIAAIADLWQALIAATEIDDTVQLPGTGLVGFGAFAFDEASAAPSTLIVPSVVVGRRGGATWRTVIHAADSPAPETPSLVPAGAPWSASLGPGALNAAAHADAVASALAAIASGEVEKVVIARDLVGRVPAEADLRRLVHALGDGYPDTWLYAVDGAIGASPETLVAVIDGDLSARVLAGTRPRGADADADVATATALAESPKDREEHRYAVQSVRAALGPLTSALAAADAPFTLKLPNLWHLATDVAGTLAEGATVLDLVGALHPTAAVAGTPTEAACDLIRRIEPFDRGRYAGPVGWVDARGDGEWAIALRGAQFGGADGDTRPVTAHAGGGIVAGSEPESELLETRVKFRPIIDALA